MVELLLWIPKSTKTLTSSGLSAFSQRPGSHIRQAQRLDMADGMSGARSYHTSLDLNRSSSFCVGRYLAEANVWIAAASLLTAFDIVKAKDESGQEIVPDVKMIEAIIRYEFFSPCALIDADCARKSRQPVPFKCDFRPRSREIQKIIEDT